MTRRTPLAIVILLAAACGDNTAPPADAGPDGTADGSVDGGADTTPPEIRDVRVLLGVDERALDVSAQDQSRVLLAPEPVVFRVFASDDVDATESLTVELYDPASGDAIADQTVVFERGLHRAQAEASAGTAFAVRVRDAAGNETSWPYQVIFPTREEALTRTWTRLVVDESAIEIAQPTATYADGRFCLDAYLAELPIGGAYEVRADGRLRHERRHALPCDSTDFGPEWDTIEYIDVTDFYVDDVNFAPSPYTRAAGSGPTVVGTWTRVLTTVDPTTGAETDAVETVVYADDGTYGRDLDGLTSQGSYALTENGSYEENFGDFLFETVEMVGGTPVTPETRARLYLMRGELLLLDPWIDIE